MIVGTIQALETARMEYPPVIRQVLQTLAGWDFSQQADGEYLRDGIAYRIFHAETAPASERQPEVHAKHIDVQFVISGEEGIGYLPRPARTPEQAFPEKDLWFYTRQPTDPIRLLPLSAGDFVVLFPWDAHAPLCRIGRCETVRKVVAKVPLQTLSDISDI